MNVGTTDALGRSFGSPIRIDPTPRPLPALAAASPGPAVESVFTSAFRLLLLSFPSPTCRRSVFLSSVLFPFPRGNLISFLPQSICPFYPILICLLCFCVCVCVCTRVCLASVFLLYGRISRCLFGSSRSFISDTVYTVFLLSPPPPLCSDACSKRGSQRCYSCTVVGSSRGAPVLPRK